MSVMSAGRGGITPVTSTVGSIDTAGMRERKVAFLDSIRGRSLRYKRYNKSILRYAGGKSLAVGVIIQHFPDDITRVISPFIGGGSVEIACALELGLQVKAFDVFDILVNFYQILLQDRKALYEALRALEPSKDIYDSIKSELQRHWRGEIALDPLRLARDYYFNHNLSYGPGFLGWMSKIYQSRSRYLSALEKIKRFKTKCLSVECSSFESILDRYPYDFLYCDPPYFLHGDSKMFRGIYPQRNFPVHHDGFDHELLHRMLLSHKGRFVLSYNDCTWVRESYKGFKIVDVSWQYTMGQGEKRIGKNRIHCGHNIKKSHEILIIKD